MVHILFFLTNVAAECGAVFLSQQAHEFLRDHNVICKNNFFSGSQ